MASSPTPSLESLPGASNSIGSYGEPTDYLSDSPLTTLSGSATGSSPPASDSAICDDYVTASSLESAQSNSSESLFPRCTGCKSKQSDAVAKCIDCVNFLCSNCVTAHQFMHCFDGHSVFRFGNSSSSTGSTTGTTTTIANGGVLGGLEGSLLANNILNSSKIMNGFEPSPHRLTSLNLTIKDDTSSLVKSIMNNVITPPTSNGTGGGINLPITTVNQLNSQLSALNVNGIEMNGPNKPNYFCKRHTNELLKFFCRTCSVPVCKDCMLMEHPNGVHECEHNPDSTPKQIENLLHTVSEVRAKATELRALIKNVEHSSQRIQGQYHKAQNEITETHQFYRSMLDERRAELLKELESFYNTKNMSQSVLLTKSQDQVDKVLQSCEFVERLSKCAGLAETIMLRKFMENKLLLFPSITQDLQSSYELDFVSNYQAIQVGVRNTFGYIRSTSDMTSTTKQPPIARPTSTNANCGSNGVIGSNLIMTNGNSPSSSTGSLNMIQHQNQMMVNGGNNGHLIDRQYSNGNGNSGNGMSMSTSPSQTNGVGGGGGGGGGLSSFDSNIISKRFNSANSLGPFVGEVQPLQPLNPYEKWSNGGTDIFNNINDQYTIPLNHIPQESMIDLSSKLMNTSIFPPKSQIKRQKMIYHCKFGEFGVMEGQFTEPSGVAVNAQNDIIVADTNNHRIQIFDKEGRFKFQFGECGKRDGQLLYPNRVAVVRTSGDIIVTERSPTHQIQIYNQYGQFVRKFGANILQHPRGVTVDSKGRIVVVECKVMRVIIFDQSGNVLQKFGCSKHLEFPNGVVVNDKQEIFISDNRAHCVKVFNYEGQFLRQIGGEGITNYPIGVGINASGEILIADNHNNFNLTIFTQDGQLVSALESKVKHAQCFDVALMDDGSVVLASKDYRLYIYRYVQVPPIGL
ncbi:brain tumor protein [Topomyia yanbarensis]|uniref:brain tumor protein n=1 Tax=Topomyia yanbarensis TaxID=2498891 RepID=UPI00273B96E1|nr:brain tumor protein [Topomyia yanbarensis]XP_058819512.1 brain tumor protein [Topomyia yanbarensis]XP_058819513.1 brain tumor protein [Topomyia yanbarensis]XP_058819514.1 brain tumor protein [Topomyia yanbarensis]XP_058819515.1 brain tumor protein [Topomyia yanbarensis]XP_058819516.1 brain tumor protein [Topomyia yanbarensis]XP_058819517.1 brain tumor protein [Topomyia yanbarensis]